MKKPIRAAIYCRVATADQFALDQQEQSVCAFAKAKGYEISSITKETYKGTTMERPGIQRILTDAEKGTMDIVLAYNISRLGRNTVETFRFIKELRGHGVVFESINEGISLDNLLDVVKKAT